jgi:hypothetical protein
MALLDNLLPSFASDRVAVFTQDFTQVFPGARPVKAVVKEEAKTMDHPLETGATTTDHRIILPIEIELSMIVTSADYQDVYRQIKQFYLNATLLVVQTKSGVYQNQLISGLPHEEDPAQFEALIIALKMKQVQFATTAYSLVARAPSNASKVNRGTVQGATTTKNVPSTAFQTYSGINQKLTIFNGAGVA